MKIVNSNITYLISTTCLALVLLLLTPTVISLIGTISPETVVELVLENTAEEEKEEERSSGEDEVKEVKEYTLPSELSNKDSLKAKNIKKHQYAFRQYSSVLSVPSLPPELIG